MPRFWHGSSSPAPVTIHWMPFAQVAHSFRALRHPNFRLFLGGQMFPVAMYPEWIQRLAHWLPFYYSVGAPTEILSAPYQAIRLTDKESSERLRRIGGIRILTRGDGALVALFENRYRLQRLEVDEPELTLLPIVAG